jgi:hypothetical protein
LRGCIFLIELVSRAAVFIAPGDLREESAMSGHKLRAVVQVLAALLLLLLMV